MKMSRCLKDGCIKSVFGSRIGLPNYQSTIAIAFVALVVSVVVAPAADARQVVLKGTIEADRICHDGANRGANIAIYLSAGAPYNEYASADHPVNKNTVHIFAKSNHKGYYKGTSCFDLNQYNLGQGTRIHVWYNVDGSYDAKGPYADQYTPAVPRKNHCNDFTIKYVTGAGEMWVQNGGTTIWNVSCIAKDGL